MPLMCCQWGKTFHVLYDSLLALRRLCVQPLHSSRITLFLCICQDVPSYFSFRKESLSETPGGAIIALLVVSTEHRDNVSWENERQRREDILTSIDPCKKEEAIWTGVSLQYRINIVNNIKECGGNEVAYVLCKSYYSCTMLPLILTLTIILHNTQFFTLLFSVQTCRYFWFCIYSIDFENSLIYLLSHQHNGGEWITAVKRNPSTSIDMSPLLHT